MSIYKQSVDAIQTNQASMLYGLHNLQCCIWIHDYMQMGDCLNPNPSQLLIVFRLRRKKKLDEKGGSKR